MTEFEIAGLIVASVNATAAVIAAVGIWHGIRAMVRANRDRGQQQSEAMQRQREADDRRHEEVMQQRREAMQQQREDRKQQREADDRRHEEAMQQRREAMQQQREDRKQQREADERRHEENMTALKALISGLERQTASLESVVERTAPPAGPAE